MLSNDQFFEIKWYNGVKKHYEGLGYTFTKKGDVFIVPLQHLSKGSRVEVKVICDYCGVTFDREYKLYNTMLKNSVVKKDSCSNCSMKKREETNLIKYGSKSHLSNPEVIEKRRKTNLNKYGYIHPMQNKEFRDNFFDANIEKLGVRYPAQNKEVMEKRINTTREIYGVDHIFQLDGVIEKGLEALKNLKRDKTSKQQVHIASLLDDVEINHRVGRYLLDIALLEDKIFIEYDGTGHNLSVRMGQLTEEEFLEKEKKRFSSLYEKGWREIRLISNNDMLPEDNYLKDRLKSEISKLKDNQCLKRIAVYLNKIEDVKFNRIKGGSL